MKVADYESAFTFTSRFEGRAGTNPGKLTGAPHAGCYYMNLSLLLTEAGLSPDSINTSVHVTIGKDESTPHITPIVLNCNVKCEGPEESKLVELAASTKEKYPVSSRYANGTIDIETRAELIN